jgi:hypothetical protein
MMADRKRPSGPPPSAGVLARYAQAYARELGVAEGRVRGWVAYMIMAGALERSTGAAGPQFIVKGGVALELRLRNRARATKDIDVVLRDEKADLADTLEQAVTGDPEAIVLTDAFGVTGPTLLPCLPLRFHVAQKLHGMTLPPRPGKQNERFRDLVDLLLMEALVTHDYAAFREACELVFRSRNTHPWPPNLEAMPSHWAAPFTRLAEELELREKDVETALIRVRSFVERILTAAS